MAQAAQKALVALGYKVEVIDGDDYRSHICSDLGFSKADRLENIRRLGFIGLTLAKQGIITILAAINPYEEARVALQSKSSIVKTVSLSCSLEALKKNDVKGLYKRALLPRDHPDYLPNFTGITAPYEPPSTPELVIQTHSKPEQVSLNTFLAFILDQLSSFPPPGITNPAPINARRALFVGRWQPFHNGHKWLIDNKLKQGVPVIIAVRDIPRDDANPFTTTQTMEMIRRVYVGEKVEVFALPDIESINYGRGVGYEVNCFSPPNDIEVISASFIRDCLKTNNEDWKRHVSAEIHDMIKQTLAQYEENRIR